MYDNTLIREVFDEETLEYLQNKNRGGASGAKGNTYENFYAVYQIVSLAPEIIENSQEINFYSQILAFVEDLIIENTSNTFIQHYQLKNSLNVNWGSGLKSISDDFNKQHQLNSNISKETKLYLVVSNQELRNNLEENMPDGIKAFSQVVYFSYDQTLIKVIHQEPHFLEAIKYLCAFENPELDKIECVATVLLGAWASSNKSRISAKEILQRAQKTNPSFIRSFSQKCELDPEVENILSKINNFSYNIAKGFLHWQYGERDSGTMRYSIDTESFRNFQQLIKSRKPATFEELEVFLL